MSEPTKNPFDLLLDQIRAVVREEIQAARPQEKMLYTTKEAAAKIGVDESWLASRARARTIPSRQLGHYRYFSKSDIDSIIASACVPVVYSTHDGQGVQADATGAQVEPGPARQGVGGDGHGGGEVGEGRATNIRAGRARGKTPPRKKEKGELSR
jgi:hypothetical protein